MTDELDRFADAAHRVIAARARGAEVGIIQLQLAAWTTGKAGRSLPELPDDTENLYLRMAAAFGAGDNPTALALVAEHCATEPNNRMLAHACHFGGPRCPDELLAIVAANRDVLFDGAMLWSTADPVKLLEVTDGDPRGSNAIATVAEVVIHARDRGAPIAAAEERWARLNAPARRPTYHASFRDGALRIAARESLDDALDLLDEFVDSRGYDGQSWGTNAVLGRLVRSDPARACEIVAAPEDPNHRVSWLGALVADFQLPPAAEPIVDELLSRDELYEAAVLARTLIVARRPDKVELALAKLGDESRLEAAGLIAPGVVRLRRAGFTAEAEDARDRVLRVLGDGVDDRGLGVRDLFDVLSSPENPPLMPWGTELP